MARRAPSSRTATRSRCAPGASARPMCASASAKRVVRCGRRPEPVLPRAGGLARIAALKNYRYYDLILGAYVCVLLCANLIGPAKQATVQIPVWGSVTFVAGVVFFPISYFFGDVLTEVYGYARDRRVVWSGFGALLFASLMSLVVVHLPAAPAAHAYQSAVETMFG